MVREIAALERARERTLIPFKAEIARLKRAALDIEEKYEEATSRLSDALHKYLELNPPEGRKKSLEFPAGYIGTRRSQGSIDVLDNTEVIAWCKTNLPGAVQIEEKPKKKLLKDHLARTGEIPPGIEYTEPEDRFYVKTK